MRAHTLGVLLAGLMAVVIVAVDVSFLRGRFWLRLIASVGIVLLFAGFYFGVLSRR